ncbi:MAG TPA: membrane protein insertase YidC, partial [Candidatus Margulisiibacteriota bacterium]|nr:membrane protein insertase YidC [Candidatus Margulisiibacteriota bacterium]
MEKRTFLALALSLLVLVSWSAFAPKPQHIANQTVITSNNLPKSESSALLPAKENETLVSTEAEGRWVNPWLEAGYSESRAALKEALFKSYQDYRFPLHAGFMLDDKSAVFKREDSPTGTLRFVATGPGKRISKELIAGNSPFEFWLQLNIVNLSDERLSLDLPLVLGLLDFSLNNLDSRYQNVIIAQEDKILHLNGRKDVTSINAKFIGISDRYFCAILEPVGATESAAFVKKLTPRQSEIGLLLSKIVIPAHQEFQQKFHIYLGPQELQSINRVNPAWSPTINYGTFDFIAQSLLWLLRFFYGLVHNWGAAIVILSLVIYLLLFPLSVKQMRSMKEMQALQPHIEELKKQHQDNPQKLNKEIMELYRTHKVNPMSGCLPLLLQMPIFFALYQALMRTVALRGAKFMWIKDLSSPDRLFTLPFSLPILGNEINILPLIMTAGMFIQQKFSTPASAANSSEQRMMLIIFPIMFG